MQYWNKHRWVLQIRIKVQSPFSIFIKLRYSPIIHKTFPLISSYTPFILNYACTDVLSWWEFLENIVCVVILRPASNQQTNQLLFYFKFKWWLIAGSESRSQYLALIRRALSHIIVTTTTVWDRKSIYAKLLSMCHLLCITSYYKPPLFVVSSPL